MKDVVCSVRHKGVLALCFMIRWHMPTKQFEVLYGILTFITYLIAFEAFHRLVNVSFVLLQC